VQVVAETTSSNDEVLRLGEKGAPSGTLLFAERQTAGRGQFRRPWASSDPFGLWFSLLLRMEISDATIPALSAFAAAALVETLQFLGILDAWIKAPNDIYIRGRKVGGILIETRPGKNPFAVVGIGLNVNQCLEDFSEELQSIATSLAMVSGKTCEREHVAKSLLGALGRYEQLMHDDPAALIACWNSLLLSAS